MTLQTLLAIQRRNRWENRLIDQITCVVIGFTVIYFIGQGIRALF